MAKTIREVQIAPEDRNKVDEAARIDGQIKELMSRFKALKSEIMEAVTWKDDEKSLRVLGADYAALIVQKESLAIPTERIAALERPIGADHFATIFERKTSYSTNRKALDAFLRNKQTSKARVKAQAELLALLAEYTKVAQSVRFQERKVG